MSNPAKPVWPDAGALPFSIFGAMSPSSATSSTFAQPLVQGLADGADFMKKLWGNVPGSNAVPGFLLPTLDLDELDKRIADLKAAESWLDVNLTLLRATIQGLQVQRHTIAAIRTLGAVTETPQPPKSAAPAPLSPSGLPPGWPVAQTSAPAPSADLDESPAEEESEAEVSDQHEADAVPEDEEPDSEPTEAIARRSEPTRKASRKTGRSRASANDSVAAATAAIPAAGLAASNWLSYMQDQFTKVAQAALASSADAHEKEAAPAAKAKPKAAKAAKTTSKRRPVAKKSGARRSPR